jgi:Arc/MetJ-type ribon-helix-helix transcriptional regulator
MPSMRTTVTLDPDVERLLKDAVRHRRQSFKQVLNDAIREGLRIDRGVERRTAFRVAARPMGLRSGIDPARLTEVGDELEVEAFLETTRRAADPNVP